jgi:hypothetical protein
LIRHKEVTYTLRHDITLHEQSLAKFAAENSIALDHKHFEDHPDLRDKVQTERKMFRELKDELANFLGKNI